MKITIQSIPHSEQRYETCGDYWIDDEGNWHIAVSDTGNDAYTLLLAAHEFVEMALCVQRNIEMASIDEFDQHWTTFDHYTEPGDDPGAPYFREHQFASGIERLMASEMMVDWAEYAHLIDNLSREPTHGE